MLKRILSICLALLAMLPAAAVRAEEGVSGVAPQRPSISTVTPVETPKPVLEELTVGDRGDGVLQLQRRLTVLGFFTGTQDGIYGEATREAVREFETYLRLLEQDEIDEEIVRLSLITPSPTPTASPVPEPTPSLLSTEKPFLEPQPLRAPEDGTDSLHVAEDPTVEPTLSPTPTPSPTPSPTPEPTPQTVMDGFADLPILEKLFDDADNLYRRDVSGTVYGLEAARVQRRLVTLNYLNDKPDGIFGVNSETALKAFQKTYGLEETGVADRQIQRMLFNETAAVSERPVYNQLFRGVSSQDVKLVQQQLILLGFMNGKVSGAYDERTENAVKQMQVFLHGLERAKNGAAAADPTATPVPEEMLKLQGEVEGDPETNPYEVMPDEGTSVPANPVIVAQMEDNYIPSGVMSARMQEMLLEEGIPVYAKTVGTGDSGPEVQRVQRRLYGLGYLTANGVDGIFGAGSERAVREFQMRNKMAETGVADQTLQTKLFSEGAVKAIKRYQIRVSVGEQKVYVYTYDERDEYTIYVNSFVCSTGTWANPTPYGTFTNTGRGARWHYFKKFDCWAQYAFYIDGDILFHSVLFSQQDESTLRQSSVWNLGSRASHGCVRLAVKDAKWIWENCAPGTTVIVGD